MPVPYKNQNYTNYSTNQPRNHSTKLKYLNALNKIPGVGSQKIRLMLDFFGEPEKIWGAPLSELKASHVGEKLAEKILAYREKINPEVEWEKIIRYNIRIVTEEDTEYPLLLKEIHNPPYLLYVRGEFNLASTPMIAIVGSRKHTSYGLDAASMFARELAQAGIIVVSGMALGIDSAVHKSVVKAGGKTVAVLGNGLDDANIYPPSNFNLSREIINQGALVSEYPAETLAMPMNFPARNRIIAGMTLGTLVVEAGEKSGALITADLALEYNREVFSVPGSIFSPQSTGTHALIKKGARTVTSATEILEELNLAEESAPREIIIKSPLDEKEKFLLPALSHNPIHIDNISKLSKLGAAEVSSRLVMMEMKGWVKNVGGQNYILL